MRPSGRTVAGQSADLVPLIRDIIAALVIGAGTGLAATWYSLKDGPVLGAVELGPWRAYPQTGSAAADLYSRAYVARSSEIPLVAGEGVEFSATIDSDGQVLNGACSYRVGPIRVPARWWTLNVDGLPTGERRGLASSEMVRLVGGIAEVRIAPSPQPGMWLQSASGQLRLVLRFYDMTSLAWLSGATSETLPAIVRETCP